MPWKIKIKIIFWLEPESSALANRTFAAVAKNVLTAFSCSLFFFPVIWMVISCVVFSFVALLVRACELIRYIFVCFVCLLLHMWAQICQGTYVPKHVFFNYKGNLYVVLSSLCSCVTAICQATVTSLTAENVRKRTLENRQWI